MYIYIFILYIFYNYNFPRFYTWIHIFKKVLKMKVYQIVYRIKQI